MFTNLGDCLHNVGIIHGDTITDVDDDDDDEDDVGGLRHKFQWHNIWRQHR